MAFSDESLVESEGVEVFEQSLRPAEALPGFRPSGIMHDHWLDQSPQSLFFRSEIPDGREFGDCAVEDGIEGVLLKIKADWPVLHDELERAGRKIVANPFFRVDQHHARIEVAVRVGHSQRFEM